MKKTQFEFIEEIMKLKKAHPTLEIMFCIGTETLDEAADWMPHKIYDIKIVPWLENAEVIFNDQDQIIGYFEERYLELPIGTQELTIEEYVQNRYAAEVKEVICVFTTME